MLLQGTLGQIKQNLGKLFLQSGLAQSSAYGGSRYATYFNIYGACSKETGSNRFQLWHFQNFGDR